MKSDDYKNSKGEQIDFTVNVFTRPNLRGSFNEMFMYQGKAALETMFDVCKVDENIKEIHFEYPERWANILELRAIPYRMITCFPNLEKVTITTHSVYIIQCVHAEHILIRDSHNKLEYEECDYGDINKRYSPPPHKMTELLQFQN